MIVAEEENVTNNFAGVPVSVPLLTRERSAEQVSANFGTGDGELLSPKTRLLTKPLTVTRPKF
jgi:hypothetical protein